VTTRRLLSIRVSIARLAGRYELTLVQTTGFPGVTIGDLVDRMFSRPMQNAALDSVRHGTLELRPTTIEPLPSWKRVTPLWGWTDLDFARVGSLAHSPASRDQYQPGVQVSFYEDSRRLSMSVGGGVYSDAQGGITKTVDSGVLLYAFRADAARIVGRWSSGMGAQGYFCADRVQDPKSATGA
jgi:hypothetical protein